MFSVQKQLIKNTQREACDCRQANNSRMASRRPGLSRRQTLCATGWEKKQTEVIPQTFHSSSILCTAWKSEGRQKREWWVLICWGTWHVPLPICFTQKSQQAIVLACYFSSTSWTVPWCSDESYNLMYGWQITIKVAHTDNRTHSAERKR